MRPIETAGMETSEVRIGTRVYLDRNGGSRVMTILGPWESKPEEDIISYESDLAKELLGKGVGDEVQISGEGWTIQRIEPVV